MAENLVVESFDFDRIEAGDPKATRDAIYSLWLILNDEIKNRLASVRQAKIATDGGVLSVAFSGNQNNYDPGLGRVILSTGATGITITGIRNGREGRQFTIHVVGAGTITLANNSGSSFTENRILTDTGADVAVETNQTAVLQYLNSRWRMWSVVVDAIRHS